MMSHQAELRVTIKQYRICLVCPGIFVCYYLQHLYVGKGCVHFRTRWL